MSTFTNFSVILTELDYKRSFNNYYFNVYCTAILSSCLILSVILVVLSVVDVRNFVNLRNFEITHARWKAPGRLPIRSN